MQIAHFSEEIVNSLEYSHLHLHAQNCKKYVSHAFSHLTNSFGASGSTNIVIKGLH